MKATRGQIWGLKKYAKDKFHGSGHKASCPAKPYAILALLKRLSGINTVVSEQTFSWFRGYARRMDELKPARRQFLVPIYAKMHNDLLEKGDTSHMGPHPRRGARRSSPYD